MNDVEARLRQTLHAELDAIAPDPRRASPALRRARLGRAVRGVAGGLACALVVAGAAVAWNRRDADETRPAAKPPERATYSLSFGEGGSGTITIDVPRAQACIDLSEASGVTAARLRRDPGPTVVEVQPGDWGAWPRCSSIDADDAKRVVREPGRHYVELHAGEPAHVSALEPLDVAPQDAPGVAQIVCTEAGAVVLTPRVRAREDGIHLRFHNPWRVPKAFNLLAEDGGNEGGRLRYGRDGNVSTFAPGLLYVACLDRLNDAVYDTRDESYASFTIVDPDGLWTDPTLECGEGRRRRVIVTDERLPANPDRLPDMEALIREHVPGVVSSDVLERPLYPESMFIFETRTVVRDGRRIATLMLVREEPYWAILPRACPRSGIAER